MKRFFCRSYDVPSRSLTSRRSRLELGVVDQHERRGDAKPWALIAPNAGGVGRELADTAPIDERGADHAGPIGCVSSVGLGVIWRLC
jgi:hypothetical protein